MLSSETKLVPSDTQETELLKITNRNISSCTFVETNVPKDKVESTSSQCHQLNNINTAFSSETDVKLPFSSNYMLMPKQSLDEDVLKFVSTFNSNMKLPLVVIQEIISGVHNLLNNTYVNAIKRLVNATADNSSKTQIIEELEYLQQIFSNFKTEWRRLQFLEKINYLILPEKIFLGTLPTAKKNGTVEMKEMCASYVPIDKVLKNVLELPNVFDQIILYCNQLNSETDSIKNLIQTDLWKKISSDYKDKIVFPLIFYEDAFETGNPLGAHAGIHKLNGCYTTIACLPPNLRSKLDFIFLTQMYYANDTKNFGKTRIFTKLLNTFKDLETNGIDISINNKTIRVYFVFTFIIGDNLGANSILGFVESFSANHFCRFCKTGKKNCHTMIEEDPKSLRTMKNYKADLKLNNYTITGIKENCCFNDLMYFDCIEYSTVDLMHDFLDGICKSKMGLILNYFIKEKKYFTLKTFNWRINHDNYNDHENKPPEISIADLNNKSIRMTASQTKTFVLHAGLIFGDLVPNYEDKHWKLFQSLREMLCLVLTDKVTKTLCNKLKSVIAEHHTTYIELYKYLTPKHHIITHYPRLMLKFGPLKDVWTMRGEAKHRPPKQYAHVNHNRKDLAYSIARRYQIAQSDFFLDTKFSDFVQFKVYRTILLNDRKYSVVLCNNTYCPIKSVTFFGTTFESGSIIVVDHEISHKFGEIKQIYVAENVNMNAEVKDFFLLLKLFQNDGIHKRFFAYSVQETQQEIFKNFSQVSVYKTFKLVDKKNNSFINYV